MTNESYASTERHTAFEFAINIYSTTTKDSKKR